MTPTTTITTIAYHDHTSRTTNAIEAVTSPPQPGATQPAGDDRRAEVLGWLTRRLDWEDHLNRLHDRRARHRNAPSEHG